MKRSIPGLLAFTAFLTGAIVSPSFAQQQPAPGAPFGLESSPDRAPVPDGLGSGIIPIASKQFTPVVSASVPGFPPFCYKLPAAVDPTRGPLYLGFYDPAAGKWAPDAEGIGVVKNGTVCFAGTHNPVVVQPNVTYYFALYQRP
ncbi:MAG: hypothetical protein DLM50_01945 [Candidatus Meridianibacter frigidus]|nr:MAG: hypothetical protein DLM50_01945 [Candidatus Eremiobacteraeota bacterium]